MSTASVLDNVSRETTDRLKTYQSLLAKWTPRINLIAPNTLDVAWKRHFEDSAQLYALAPQSEGTWLDLGSGGGFPGLVVAIMLAETDQNYKIVLMESDTRKCAFLRTVIREVGIEAEVVTSRIENASPQEASVISARALSQLSTLLNYAQRHGTRGTTCLFQKGRTWEQEIDETQTEWRFNHTVHQSTTDPEAVILRIEDIERV